MRYGICHFFLEDVVPLGFVCFAHVFCVYQNLSTWVKIHQPIAQPDQLGMICSTGKQPLWDQTTLHTLAVSFSLIFTFLPIILSSHQRFTSPHVFIIATSTPMEEFALIFSRISGVQHWQFPRSCSVSAPFWLIQTQMTHWFLISHNFSRLTELDMIAQPESGHPSTPCNPTAIWHLRGW